MQQNIRHQFADAEELVDSGSFVVVVLLYNPQLQSKMGAIVLYPSRCFNKVRNIDLRKDTGTCNVLPWRSLLISYNTYWYIKSISTLTGGMTFDPHTFQQSRTPLASSLFSPAAPFYSSVRYSVRKYCTYDVDFLQILIYSRLYVFSLCGYSFSYITLSSLFFAFFPVSVETMQQTASGQKLFPL